MKASLSPEEASLQLGMSPRVIRQKMRLGEIDLGVAIPPQGEKNTGCSGSTGTKSTR